MDTILADPPERTGPHTDDHWYSVDQIITDPRWSSISKRTIYNAVARGELMAARLGVGRRRLVIRGAWINAWLEAAALPTRTR